MRRKSYVDGDYTIYHVNYLGKYGGDDTVCQVQGRYREEIAHCTWHPNNNSITPTNRHVKRYISCPYENEKYCLERMKKVNR